MGCDEVMGCGMVMKGGDECNYAYWKSENVVNTVVLFPIHCGEPALVMSVSWCSVLPLHFSAFSNAHLRVLAGLWDLFTPFCFVMPLVCHEKDMLLEERRLPQRSHVVGKVVGLQTLPG